MASSVRALRSCVVCGLAAPETTTEYTLISSRYGWRLLRRRDASGNYVFEWRCPPCWSRYRQVDDSAREDTVTKSGVRPKA